jgi:hypothetical protein
MNDLNPRIASAIETKSGPDIIMMISNWPHLYADGLADVDDLAGEIAKQDGAYYERKSGHARRVPFDIGGPPRPLPRRQARSSGFPSRSSARSTLMSTANPFLSGSRSFSGWTRRCQTFSYAVPDLWICAMP